MSLLAYLLGPLYPSSAAQCGQDGAVVVGSVSHQLQEGLLHYGGALLVLLILHKPLILSV